MITELDKVKLKTGEELRIKCIEVPEDKYREKIGRFLEHKGEAWGRDIKERLEGKFINSCIDRYFVGEINGNIVSQMWYGLPRDGTGMAEFGHVYTEPECRGKGIASKLMEFLAADFQKSKGNALFCGTGNPHAAKIYRRNGFQNIEEGKETGAMVLIKSNYASNFSELENKYFEPGLEINVLPATRKEQFDVDKVFHCSTGLKTIAENWHTVFLASQVSSLRAVLFKVEDGKGLATVAKNSKGNIVGYAYILSFGSLIEEKSKILDFIIHPNYLKNGIQILQETVEIGKKQGIENIRCYVSSRDKEKSAILLKAGFKEECSLSNYCFIDNNYFDLKILKKIQRN